MGKSQGCGSKNRKKLSVCRKIQADFFSGGGYNRSVNTFGRKRLKMKKIYFVGNAHLDPVWRWHWQEGSAEAKATIRSALDRMKEYPDFKFVCSSSVVYEWIEEYDRDMFEEIKERVAEGRFVIVGGWYIQPDCNLPSGESFARHSLYGQRYFMEKFGKMSGIGYNVDSFGHNLMLPQILKKSGMKNYVFMRPNKSEKEMPSELFRWQSPDGSSVTAWRIIGCYCEYFGSCRDLERTISNMEKEVHNPTDSVMLFYGVGNHGGGPTKKNIDAALEYQKNNPDKEIIFSDISDFFAHAESAAAELPVHTDDLQHHASGCYSAVSFIKNGVRRAEKAMYAAEVFAFAANAIMKSGYDCKAFERAWKNILFCHFHDIMGGCSIKGAYTDAGYMLGETMSFAMKTENTALQRLSWKIDTADREKGCPVIFFNPHGFDVEETVTVNSRVSRITDAEGNRLTVQHVHPQYLSGADPKDTAFVAKVPAMGYATYFMKEGCPDDIPSDEVGLHIDGLSMENENLRVTFEKHTGYIKSIFDKEHRIELLDGCGAVPTVIDEFEHDTWSHARNYFDKIIAVFSDGELTIVENGSLRVTMKAVNRYNGSTLTQYFSLCRGEKKLRVRARVDWQEKHKMLKLAYKTVFGNAKAYYEIPFGVIERPTNGEEEPGQSFVALREGEGGIAILNNNKYSFSVSDNVMNLTVVRSPIYCDHGGKRDDEYEFTDIGTHDFDYAIMPICESGWSEVIREAQKLNLPMTYIKENNHEGSLPQKYRGFECDRKNIIVSALKMSEDGRGIVIRVYETDGVDTHVRISGDLLPKELSADVGAWSVNTYLYSFGTGEWKEVLLTEYDM